jgi:hypothetical protein
MSIWVNEQIDPGGLIYSCIACCDEQAARDCHHTWKQSLSDRQKQEGSIARLRTVETWDDVPVNALKLSY